MEFIHIVITRMGKKVLPSFFNHSMVRTISVIYIFNDTNEIRKRKNNNATFGFIKK